jgi:hypothetical protein
MIFSWIGASGNPVCSRFSESVQEHITLKEGWHNITLSVDNMTMSRSEKAHDVMRDIGFVETDLTKRGKVT